MDHVWSKRTDTSHYYLVYARLQHCLDKPGFTRQGCPKCSLIRTQGSRQTGGGTHRLWSFDFMAIRWSLVTHLTLVAFRHIYRKLGYTRLDGSPIKDIRETLDIEQGFLDEVVQPEDGGHWKRRWASQWIHHVGEPVESFGINFDDEIRVLVLFSSLSEVWDGLVMTMSNFSGIGTLKFDDVEGVLLCKEAYRKSSGAAKTSGSVLSIERKEDNWIEKRKRMTNSSLNQGEVIPSQGVPDVGSAVKRGII